MSEVVLSGSNEQTCASLQREVPKCATPLPELLYSGVEALLRTADLCQDAAHATSRQGHRAQGGREDQAWPAPSIVFRMGGMGLVKLGVQMACAIWSIVFSHESDISRQSHQWAIGQAAMYPEMPRPRCVCVKDVRRLKASAILILAQLRSQSADDGELEAGC